MEAPQVLNERYFAKVVVDENMHNFKHNDRVHGVYGGVKHQLGHNKFNLAWHRCQTSCPLPPVHSLLPQAPP